MNKEILRNIKIKPLCLLFRNYSETSQVQSLEEFFKFYSDSGKYEERYKPLTEKDYVRFISTRAAKREPALTRQISKCIIIH